MREDRRELAADHAAAEHDQALGHVVDLEQPVESRQRAWSMPGIGGRGGRDPVAMTALLKRDVLPALDLQRVRAREAAPALDDLDADALHEPAEALDDAVHDAAGGWAAPAAKSSVTPSTLMPSGASGSRASW